MLRSLFTAALMVAMAACRADLPHTEPTPVVRAVFDPTASKIPLPNDLVFLNPVNTVCPPPIPSGTAPGCAQAELLATFAGQFPSDQEVAVTIEFVQTNFNADGTTTEVAPELDLTTFTSSTVFVIGTSGGVTSEVPLAPVTAADYRNGTLSLHHLGRTPWPEGSYAVVMRGGANGVKTVDGTPVTASQIFTLIAQGLDMTDPKNIGLLKAQTGSTAAALQQGAQLNLLISLYKSSAFVAAETKFPHEEMAIATTFRIAPVVTNVTIDPARGLVPLPIDLLRDPTKGTLTPLAACTLAGSSLRADGTCPSPAAAGFQALDGFSTTGAILGPTSELIQPSTVTALSLRLYDLTDPAAPTQVPAASLIIEPCEFTRPLAPDVPACTPGPAVAQAIAIQPAGATAVDPAGSLPSVFRTKPLKDNTNYAVVMTTDIHDKADKPIGPGTVAKVLRFTNPILVDGHSALQGIDDGTAAALEKMRLQLQPVFTTLAAGGIDRSKVAMAYTFKTQTILTQAVGLGALPYNPALPPASALTSPVNTLTPDDAFLKYGVIKGGTTAGTVPNDNIDEILEVDITTFNLLDPASGAFFADPTKAVAEPIHVLIATPKAANVPVTCPGLGKCAPMMIFRHGLRGGRAAMLTVADSYAAKGLVTVAIDAAKHGDRSFCTSGTTGPAGGCNPTVACTAIPGMETQGDVSPPGRCADGKLFKRGVSPTITDSVDGIAVASSNYLVTANFFRTRDTLRQDIIDQSQLVRAIAFIPPAPAGVHHLLFEYMATHGGVVINPAEIYFSGQSLGAIQGTADVAANPRISKAVFNVGGGTIVDIFTNSPAFKPTTDALLAGLGIMRGTSQFLQFLVVAKTVLDPADPINFAGHLTDAAHTLPNLLVTPTRLQDPKKVLTQVANCDAVVPANTVVPNAFGFLHASNIYANDASPPLFPFNPAFFSPTPTDTGLFQLFIGADFETFPKCTTGGVDHGFFTNWAIPSLTTNAQTDAAAFAATNTLPLRLQHQ